MTADEMKPCPYCAEPIRALAHDCQFCGRDVREYWQKPIDPSVWEEHRKRGEEAGAELRQAKDDWFDLVSPGLLAGGIALAAGAFAAYCALDWLSGGASLLVGAGVGVFVLRAVGRSFADFEFWERVFGRRR